MFPTYVMHRALHGVVPTTCVLIALSLGPWAAHGSRWVKGHELSTAKSTPPRSLGTTAFTTTMKPPRSDIYGEDSSLPSGVPQERIQQAKISEETKLACETTPVFTLCSGGSLEFFYDHSGNACVAYSPKRVGVCNRGPNRFSSKENCWQRCIDGRSTAAECRQEAVFGECHVRDFVRTWWYSDGKRCRRWHFPNGRCPDGGRGVVFSTSADCDRQCSHRFWRRPCRAPKRVICDPKHLRFPYYADGGSDNHRPRSCRLLSADREHYCLAGANRFPTMEACRKTCPWRYGVSQRLHTRAGYGERLSGVFITPGFEGF